MQLVVRGPRDLAPRQEITLEITASGPWPSGTRLGIHLAGAEALFVAGARDVETTDRTARVTFRCDLQRGQRYPIEVHVEARPADGELARVPLAVLDAVLQVPARTPAAAADQVLAEVELAATVRIAHADADAEAAATIAAAYRALGLAVEPAADPAAAGLFVLLWTRAAARSPTVERAWRQRLRARGARSILPDAGEPPSRCPPPRELATLDFESWRRGVRWTEDAHLPPHLRFPPRNRLEWDRPTAWLLGTKLVASLRDIALSGLYQSDPRDWMEAGPPVDLTDEADGEAWIDFVADTGDSPRLVYQLAYLLQQKQLTVGGRTLPRGRALVFGGDTAYPVADPARLVERILAPVQWARDRLRNEDGGAHFDERVVPILGIPGNHDYYDILDGYVRQFRARPAEAIAPRPPAPEGVEPIPRLPRPDLLGYRAVQGASYFAARLPFDWQLWGLDVEFRQLDDRQRHYFHQLAAAHPSRSRIIVNSRPPVIYHARNAHAAELQMIYRDLGLKAPFMAPDGEPDHPDALTGDEVQLDLSGDTHTYERYWGTDAAGSALAGERGDADGGNRRPDSGTDARSRPRAAYASVVSGLGAAFHHPGQVRLGAMPPRIAWPPAQDSAERVGHLLLRPRKVFQAGAVGVIGALFALLGFLAVQFTAPERPLFERRRSSGWLFRSVARATPRAIASPDARWCDGAGWPGGSRKRPKPDSAAPQLARCDTNPLAIPLALPDLDPVARGGLQHLGALALFSGLLGGLALALALIARLRRSHGAPFRGHGLAPRGWGRVAAWLAERTSFGWLMRWAGASRRSAQRTLAAAPAGLLMLGVTVAVLWLLIAVGEAGRYFDAYAPIHLAVLGFLAGMTAMGAVLGAKRHAPRSRWRGFGKRVALGALGLLTGALILWTPFAWTTVLAGGGLRSWWWWPALAGFVALRLVVGWSAGPILHASPTVRRVLLIALYVVMVGFYVAVPWLIHRQTQSSLHGPLAWWGLVPGVVLGAYLACHWLGWYFLLCLQWNAHGNEAGVTARVDDYAAFLRIRLTRGRAEVWAIAPVERPAATPPPWRPSAWWRYWREIDYERPAIGAVLVDHFTVGRER